MSDTLFFLSFPRFLLLRFGVAVFFSFFSLGAACWVSGLFSVFLFFFSSAVLSLLLSRLCGAWVGGGFKSRVGKVRREEGLSLLLSGYDLRTI
jgi:hypothetical protein